MSASSERRAAPATVLLLHAGIADSRMWQPQVELLEASGYRVVAPDLRGFGQRPVGHEPWAHVRDVEALLTAPAAVVGCSLGGRVALELAVARPDLVTRLVVIAPGLPGWDWSQGTRAGWEAEGAAFDAGDLEAAAEASLQLWLDGPHRPPGAVDPGLRSLVREMILRSYELEQAAAAGSPEEDGLDPPVEGRLGEIACPTLVVVGDEDVADMQAIAGHVTASIGGARLSTIAGASHLPSLERPEAVNPLLLSFLAQQPLPSPRGGSGSALG